MKLFAILIILEIVLGALPAFSGLCADGHSDAVSVAAEQSQSDSSTPSGERPDPDGNLNHRCHLGHCVFVIQYFSARLKPGRAGNEMAPSTKRFYFSYISKPFRPPIA